MPNLLSHSTTNQVIDYLEDVLKLTLYEQLAPSQVFLVREHLRAVRQITDDFSIQVGFETTPPIRQTKITFTLTPKATLNG